MNDAGAFIPYIMLQVYSQGHNQVVFPHFSRLYMNIYLTLF